MTEKRYLLDANIFIEASRKYYHFDICPDFWPMLIEQHEAGRVSSIDRVKKELMPAQKADKDDEDAKHDSLALWVRDKAPKTLFRSCDDLFVPASYQKIIRSVFSNPQYFDRAKEEFGKLADSWLIAYAHAHNMTIVSHENNSPDSKKRVLMPVICKEFGVPVVTLFEMLLDLKIKFVHKQITTRKKRE